MKDDIISLLTQEVKEEVVQQYLYQRQLIEEQVNYLMELVQETVRMEEKLYKGFARVYELLIEPEFVDEFGKLLGLEEAPFRGRSGRDANYRKGLRLIRVRSLSHRRRFKKLIIESYRRLYVLSEEYRTAYENLKNECRSVNHNLKEFEDNYDLLTILSFLRDMDIQLVQKKHFMGENFTPEELASIDASLRFKPVRIEEFNLICAPRIPELTRIEKRLGTLADHVYSRCMAKVRDVMR